MSVCGVAGDRAAGDHGRASDQIHRAGGQLGGVAGDRAAGDLNHASVSGNIDGAAVRLSGIVRDAAVCYRQRAVRPDAAAVLRRGIVLNQAAGHGKRSVVDNRAAAEGKRGIVFKRTAGDREHRSGRIDHRAAFQGSVAADRTAGDGQHAFVDNCSAAAGVVGSGDRAGLFIARVGNRQRAVDGEDAAACRGGGQMAVNGMTVQVERDLRAGRDGQCGILCAGSKVLLQRNASSRAERRLQIGPVHFRRRSLRLCRIDRRRFTAACGSGDFSRPRRHRQQNEQRRQRQQYGQAFPVSHIIAITSAAERITMGQNTPVPVSRAPGLTCSRAHSLQVQGAREHSFSAAYGLFKPLL